MTTNPLGPLVSRYIDGRDKQLAGVVYQSGKPPLDAELNLSSLIELEAQAESIRAEIASGWLMNESNPRADFTTSPSYSNQFYFGRNTTGEIRDLSWAAVNGWMIPVSGTQTGAPPLSADDVDTWNRILLNPPSTSTGGNRAEFIFLEVWIARIDVDPAPPTIAAGKPQRGFLYRFGNVEGGFSYLPDDLIDPNLNAESTKRTQIQYRIRVVTDVNLAQYPEGFDPTSVFAQGLLTTPSSVGFQNMRETLGDPGLWRSGTGDSSTFGTVDGYVYAIPLCAVFRRNGAGFSDIGNLAGAFNRNSKATLRTNATTYTNTIALPTNLAETDVSFTLTSITGTVLSTMTSFGEAYFRIDDEIVQVSNVQQIGPTSFLISLNRGQLQTTVRSHLAATTLTPYTVRPDGLFADQVTATDILDLRHSVASKFDYNGILKTNLVELLKGNLRTTWKRFGSTNSSGPVVFYGDRITDSTVFTGGLTRLDAPNGNRRLFSDAVVTERYSVPVAVPSNSNLVGDFLQVSVQPYNIAVTWSGTPPTHIATNRLSGGLFPSWWNGDQITVSLSSFQNGLPVSDSDQVRFVLPSEDPDAVLIRFEGMTTDPNGGASGTTSQSATLPHLTTPPVGNLILKNGHGVTITTDPSGNLQITFNSGTVDTEVQEFLDAMQANTTSAYAQQVMMHISFAVATGSGRGLSHKPDFVHTVHFRGSPTNTSKVMLRGGISDRSRMIPTYLVDSPYVQTGQNRQLSRTSEVMIDPGSKSVYVAPYRNVLVPNLLCRNGDRLNWTYNGITTTYQGGMPALALDNLTTAHQYVDDLQLFYHGTQTLYVEVPMDFLPRPGLHHIPIIPTTNSVFPSGINFLVMSKEGPNVNSSDYNINLVAYSTTAGYCVVTPKVGEVYGEASGTTSVFGLKYTNILLTSQSGGPFRGIKFPPFYAPSRITAVYLRQGTSVTPLSSPFDSNRVFVGAPGSDVNLLKDSFDGPTILIDVDTNGDAYFVLNVDVIDLTKAPSGTTFDNSDFIIECSMIGFDRGFLQTNGRLLITKNQPLTVDTFTTPTDGKVGIIVPAPMSSGASNNELTVYYSRTPYQGDAFGTQSAFSDDSYRLGPLAVSEASGIRNSPLGPVSTLTFANKGGFEILASTSFITSLGTGRLSGSVPLPLLNTTENPTSPPDVAGTIQDLNRRFSLNRVGYEDWNAVKFPVVDAAFASRPDIMTGALAEVYDNDVHPEFAGCTVHLPLGAYFRDKDFIGKTLYQTRSSSGVGTIPVGTLSFVNYESSMTQPSAGSSTWEGTEFICGNASGTAGVGSEALIRVDGTASTTDTSNFKTTRGGAAYSGTGPWPGGVISSRFPKARPNTEVGSVLLGTAYLVRSQPETNFSAEIHQGHELQMVIVTQAVPSYFRDTDIVHSAAGTNEGFTAVDRYRLLGRPLEKRRGFVDTTVVPASKPLFVNKIYDNPLFFGSSDISLNSQKQEVLPVLVNGQTTFTLSQRPLDPTAVQFYLRGVKLTYGVDYTVGGVTNQTVTYLSAITLLTTDTCEFFYLLF